MEGLLLRVVRSSLYIGAGWIRCTGFQTLSTRKRGFSSVVRTTLCTSIPLTTENDVSSPVLLRLQVVGLMVLVFCDKDLG